MARAAVRPVSMWLVALVASLAVLPCASGMAQPASTSRQKPGGRGRPPGKSQANKARKAAETVLQQKSIDAKLQADASFFWQCVSKHQTGGIIAGTSGLVPPVRDAARLFGSSATSSSGSIDFERYNAIPVARAGAGSDEADVPPMESFEELSGGMLPSWACTNLLDALRMGYKAPTPIQRHAVPLALASHDLIACAQTGSGKTVAFLLPLLARVAGKEGSAARRAADPPAPLPKAAAGQKSSGRLSQRDEDMMRSRGTPARPTALVLAPTRELAIQIELECAKLCFDAPPPPSGAAHWSSCAYGGATARPQLESLAAGVEILVATPGRLNDFVNRDLVDLANVHFLVLDEADRMLDMGFAPQIDRICALLPQKRNRQTLMFSATFAPPIQRVAAEYLRAKDHTAHVTVGRVGSSLKSITQRLVLAESGNRRSKLAQVRAVTAPSAGCRRSLAFRL